MVTMDELKASGELDRILRDAVAAEPTTSTVVVERGPVELFADAVVERSAVYRDRSAAHDAGFTDIPAPPTFAFVMTTWGKFGELQPPEPQNEALTTALSQIRATGGMVLHGEQAFVYHRPVVVGDVLVGTNRLVDAYQKESKGVTMTFLVSETVWRDQATGDPVVTTTSNILHRI